MERRDVIDRTNHINLASLMEYSAEELGQSSGGVLQHFDKVRQSRPLHRVAVAEHSLCDRRLTCGVSGDMYVPTKPYQIPYRMILPKRHDTDNLLVPVCFSATHVAYSTLRIEPQYMIIGQAAGVAAAIAVHGHETLYEIPIPELQRRLEAGHAVR
jgi:hypothetical protein